MTVRRSAVVLLSGGVDSSTTLAVARSEGFQSYALTFRYGQRHESEIAAAQRVAKSIGVVRHVVLDIDLRQFGGSALTDAIAVPKSRSMDEIGQGVPVSYVPARNTIFLSVGLAWAEVLEASGVFIGVNALDYSGYPDCRPEFIVAYQRMADLATKAAVEGNRRIIIHTPLIGLTKKEIIERGHALGVDYGLTRSCYDPDVGDTACGECDACILRLRGFSEAGLSDPILYRSAKEHSP